MQIKILLTDDNFIDGSKLKDVDISKNFCDFYSKKYHALNIKFDVERIFNATNNLNLLAYWRMLFEATIETNPDLYNGIIIMHRMNIFTYTAIFLSFLLSGFQIPVLLVPINNLLCNSHTNEYLNFSGAVSFIAKQRVRGVFVAIHNGDRTYIHLASRLTQAWPMGYGYRSLDDVYFGIMDENGFQWNKHKYNPTIEDLNCKKFIYNKITYLQDNDIVYIKSYIGLNYEIYNLKEKPKAVFHELYHSGTACTEADIPQYTITWFAKKCINKGIDFYAAPFDTQNINPESNKIEAVGVRFIKNMSVEAAYVKLVVAYGLFSDKNSILNFLNENTSFEKIY